MNLFEFQEAVKNGQITDFEPYMHKQKFDMHRMILAENGIEIDRIIKRDGNRVIINLIEQGLETERYDDWKNHHNYKVRYALAEKGYYPDLYINDKSPDVRREVIRQYPKQRLKRMHNHNDRYNIRLALVKETNPDMEVLSTFLETITKSELKEAFAQNDIQALQLKHKALTTVPSAIEKTMSPYQLYASNSPLWTVKLCANQIESFLDIEKNKGKLSETMFKRTYEYETQGEYCFDIETGGSPYTHSITVYKKG